MARISNCNSEMRVQTAPYWLRKTEQRSGKKAAKSISTQKATKARKSKQEKKKEATKKRVKQMHIRRNSIKFDQCVKEQQDGFNFEHTTSTSFQNFRRASSAPPEFPSASIFRKRNRTVSSASSNHAKEDMQKKPELQILMQKFDFEKAVKILRLRKEYQEEQRIQRLKKTLSKNHKEVVKQEPFKVIKPLKFTIKILKPVNT